MEFLKITENKKDYLDLLLLGDEQESMIDRYLNQGELFVLLDNGVKTVCVVTQKDDQSVEIKNLATAPEAQNRGYGKKMVNEVCRRYQGLCRQIWVGTGDSPLTIPFYEKCGFQISHRVPNFFLDHYDHPIFEGGTQLVDMVYLQKSLVD